MNQQINPIFWNNKKVLLTGHTGFKGSWLGLWLQSMGSDVLGLSLEPNTEPALFNIAKVAQNIKHVISDINCYKTINNILQNFKPEIIIHMAAQPLVRYSYDNPVETFQTNVMGTVHVLESARKIDSVRAILNVTTDKCYENREWNWGYRENEPMGGYDPYSSSKGCSELVTNAYRKSYFSKSNIGLASARAGNVIGGGDWSKDRLIPDILKCFEKKKSIYIRNPNAVRPWQHVLEPLSGYLLLCERLYENGKEYEGGWNFGPNDEDARPVSWIVKEMLSEWGDDKIQWKTDVNKQPYESNFLKLDISKVKSRLGWYPVWNLKTALRKVLDWHNAWLKKKDMRNVIHKQIDEYQSAQQNSKFES